MTCVAGLIDGGNVWMGGDSYSGDGDCGMAQVNRKIIRHGEMLIGACGQGRALQIVQYMVKPPTCRLDAMAYLVAEWVPEVRQKLQDHGHCPRKHEADEMSCAFLVGFKGKLFFVGGDFAVDEAERYHAIGSGELAANGALAVLDDSLGIPADERVRRALEAAGRHVPSVKPPYFIECV